MTEQERYNLSIINCLDNVFLAICVCMGFLAILIAQSTDFSIFSGVWIILFIILWMILGNRLDKDFEGAVKELEETSLEDRIKKLEAVRSKKRK